MDLMLRGWLHGDFHPGLISQLGIQSWEKLQIYEKFQHWLKIFQPELTYNDLEKKLKI